VKIFWSYARLDDQEPARKVSKLRKAFETSLSQTVGRKCDVYYDKLALKWGVKWRDGIEELVKKSVGFVAIVTPSYFNSRMCIFELDIAVTAGKRILPIYFRTCKELKSTFKEDGLEAEINKKLNSASVVLDATQMRDFRELRNEKLDSRAVEDFLDGIAEEIA
jgi:hypothetical protein